MTEEERQAYIEVLKERLKRYKDNWSGSAAQRRRLAKRIEELEK